MAKTVVGLFDDRAAAENAVRELTAEGFRGDEVSVVSKRPDGKGVEVEYVEEDGREQIEDMAKGAGTYAEGLKRGGTLVTVNTDNERADRAVGVMRRMGAVEIDKRAAEWREGGWRGFAETETLRPHVTPGADDRRSEVTAEHEPPR